MFEEQTVRQVSEKLRTDRKLGLSEQEADRRLRVNGENVLAQPRKRTLLSSFWDQLNTPLIYVLLAAAAVSILLDEISDAVIILVVVLVNSVVGMIQEGKAQKALDSLKKLTSPKACVIRAGKEMEIPAAGLVEGDLVCLDAGRQVPADLRLVETVNLKIEESALTGESLPIEKDAGFVAVGKLPLGDRKNMAYMSTMTVGGRGHGIVTSTGMNTEIGKIASMLSAQKEEQTPLQKRLGDLGKVLSILSVALCASLFVLAVFQKRDLMEMLITAISLAVAAVPEGLPAVVTICLALSVTRMVKVHTIVRRLPAIETLGAVSIVCSDKTGTLTQNKMTVVQCFADQKLFKRGRFPKKTYQELLEGMVLCNDAVLEGEQRIGDPTELALLEFAGANGVSRRAVESRLPREKELAFDSGRKMMSTWHQENGRSITYTKGAPDEVLKRCTHVLSEGREIPLTERHRMQIRRATEEMSFQALRTLAVAMKRGDAGPVERELTFVGMVGMEDPIRPEAAQAVERFRRAGVRTVMITGDHVDTAFAIARQLGIAHTMEECMTGGEIQRLADEEFRRRAEQTRVFARVSPEHKVRIVKTLKNMGSIVAMTGDGVNDAPSLKCADIGVAMGMSGTDVAKQASDMILTDDNFATIEKAIEEGRGVYENIRKSVLFLLSSNFGEIMTMFAAVLCGLASPLKSSHILWINLITDSLPALALGVDENDGDSLMSQPPRHSGDSLFAHGGLLCTLFYGGLIGLISLTAFLTLPYGILKAGRIPLTLANVTAALGREEILNRAQTYAFTVLGMSQLFHAVGMRDVAASVFRMPHWNNKLMIAACGLGLLLQLAVTEIPFLTAAFGTVSLSLHEWLYLGGLAAFPLVGHEILILCGAFRNVSAQGGRVTEMETYEKDSVQ